MLDETEFLASDIMTRDVAVVHPETTLLAAVKLMASRGVSGLPVVDDHGTLVGILSEGGLLRWHAEYTEREERWLNEVAEGSELAPDYLREMQEQRREIEVLMSPSPIGVTETTPARKIALLMHTRGIEHAPVLRDGKLVGIVTRADLVRALAQKLSEVEPPEPSGPISVDEAFRLGREETLAAEKTDQGQPISDRKP